MPNYFEENKMPSLERVILAEDIKIPYKIHKIPFCKNGYRSIEDHTHRLYKDTLAKFFFPIMTPMMSQTQIQEAKHPAPLDSGRSGDSLPTKAYTTTNYIQLFIPRYIMMNFKKKVPKGTEFIVASMGGTTDLEDMRIVGIFTMPAESEEAILYEEGTDAS